MDPLQRRPACAAHRPDDVRRRQPSARRGRARGWPPRHTATASTPTRASRAASVASCVPSAFARAAWISAVTIPRSRARAVKSCPPAAATSATRQASSTPGMNSCAKARCPCSRPDPPGASQVPLRWPRARGTRSEPSRVRADCTTTSGLSPCWSVRKTLTISGSAGSPSASTMRQMIEVLDCSPVSTAELDSDPAARPVELPRASSLLPTEACASSELRSRRIVSTSAVT